jgi:LAS superfamily LD-carboxypeptidase LdcB
MLLHHAYVASQQAEEAERAGKSNAAHAHRAFLKQAELSDEQARSLNEIAADCEREVAALDAKAKAIIDARRALYTAGALPKSQPLPPSPELQALQRERNAAILRARDRLRSSLDEQAWARLEVFVNSRITPGITITQRAAAQVSDASGVESDQ